MRRETGVQGDLVVTWAEMPRSPGHAFYDRLQSLLNEAGFDPFVEDICKPYYAPRMGAPSLPPGRYFRMHMIGYFEGIDSERGIVWRCSDSYSLRDFLRLGNRDRVPDHSWLSKTRSRLPHEVHEQVFGWVLALVAEGGLVKGERIGVDGSTMEANAALRTIIRRDSGETYRQMLTRMAQESGVATPTLDDLVRLDRARKGKKLSNEDWTSPTDADAKIARMKDGTTRLAYKPEHAVDLDTGVIVAAPIHPADEGDTTTLKPTLDEAEKNLSAMDLAPTREDPCDRSNDTHASATDDPDARLFRKGQGKEARLCHMGHIMTENRHGLIIDARLTEANGTAECATALDMVEDHAGRRSTLGADKNYDTAGFVAGCRARRCVPHVAQNNTHRRSAIDRRTTRHPGYAISQIKRKRIEEPFGWMKTIGGLRKTRHRGRPLVQWLFVLTAAAYNLIRIPKLLAAG